MGREYGLCLFSRVYENGSGNLELISELGFNYSHLMFAMMIPPVGYLKFNNNKEQSDVMCWYFYNDRQIVNSYNTAQ